MNPSLFAIQETFGGVFVALLNTLTPAGLLALAVWTIFRLFPNLSAAVRYGAWWAVLIAVLAMPFTPRVFNVQYRFIRANPMSPAIASAKLHPSLTDDFKPDAIAGVSESAAAKTVTVLTSEAVQVPRVIPEVSQSNLLDRLRGARVTLPTGNWIPWIVGMWLAAGIWRLARIVRSYACLRSLLMNSEAVPDEARARLDFWINERKLRRSARMVLSQQASGPLVFGLFQPTIALPASLLQKLTAEELDHVLLHELAHIARRDNWTNLLARLIGVVAGLHPIGAYALHQIEHNRELACDDWVVNTTGQPHSYAAALTRIFELSHPSIATAIELTSGMAADPSPSHLGTRIGYLLKHGRTFTPRIPRHVWAMQLVALAGLILLGAQSPRWVAMAQDRPTASKGKPTATPSPTVGVQTTPQPTGKSPSIGSAEPERNQPAHDAVGDGTPASQDVVNEIIARVNLAIDHANAITDITALPLLMQILEKSQVDLNNTGNASVNDLLRYLDTAIAQIEQRLELAGKKPAAIQQRETLQRLKLNALEQLARSAQESGTYTPDRAQLIDEALKNLRGQISDAPDTALSQTAQDLESTLQRLGELRTRYTADQKERTVLGAEIGIIPKRLANLAEQQARVAREQAQVQRSMTAAQLRHELYLADAKQLLLQRELSQMQKERQDLLAVYKPQHPKVNEVEQKIAALRLEMATIQIQLNRLASEMQRVNGQPQADSEQRQDVASRTSEFLADQLDEEQKKAGPVNTDRIIELQKKLLAARQTEILEWMNYAAQMRAQTESTPKP